MNSPIRASTCCHRLTWCGYSVLSRSNTQVSIWLKARGAFVMVSSRHRKAQRLAAARHVNGCKSDRGEAAGAAIALVVDFELALAGAKLPGAAPVQWLVLQLDGAVIGIDGFGKAEDLPRLAGDIGMQAFAGLDAIPAAAGDGVAIVGCDRRHHLVRRVVAPGQSGGGGRLHRVDHGREKSR